MNVGDLKEKLNQFDENLEIVIYDEMTGAYYPVDINWIAEVDCAECEEGGLVERELFEEFPDIKRTEPFKKYVAVNN